MSSDGEMLNDFFDDILSFLNVEIVYIQLCLKYLPVETERESKPKKVQRKFKIRWTGNKIDLIELIYALYHSECINNGNMDIKTIMENFEDFFNINLGKYYRSFTDITRRKIVRAKFIEQLLYTCNELYREKDAK